MRPSKILILVAVAFLVFGSAGFAAYKLFPMHFDFMGKKAPTPVPLPTPDPGIAEFDVAMGLQKSGKLSEARDAWIKWLEAFPKSPKVAEAKTALGKINTELLSSPTSQEDKTHYTVVKGDSLSRIARLQKSNAELIKRVNNLPNINLQIGDELLIPQLQMSIVMDPANNALILNNHDQFFKSYPLLSTPPQKAPSKNATSSVVVDKIALSGNKRVAFGDKKYPDSNRTNILRSSPNIVAVDEETISPVSSTSTNSTNSVTTNTPTMPPGYVISVTDMKEIFPLINKDTPVTIH